MTLSVACSRHAHEKAVARVTASHRMLISISSSGTFTAKDIQTSYKAYYAMGKNSATMAAV